MIPRKSATRDSKTILKGGTAYTIQEIEEREPYVLMKEETFQVFPVPSSETHLEGKIYTVGQ
jgi:hypothetical protein